MSATLPVNEAGAAPARRSPTRRLLMAAGLIALIAAAAWRALVDGGTLYPGY
jgi:membrane fusion protein (multidrug efflux system)